MVEFYIASAAALVLFAVAVRQANEWSRLRRWLESELNGRVSYKDGSTWLQGARFGRRQAYADTLYMMDRIALKKKKAAGGKGTRGS